MTDEQSSPEPAIRLDGLTKTFGKVVAVDGIDLDIAQGEFFSMLGPSGSGKTTVLRVIAGFEMPTGGSIRLAGRDVTRLAPFERDVNTVFQDYALFPHMSVRENVAYGLRVRHVPRAKRRAMAEEALATVRMQDMVREMVRAKKTRDEIQKMLETEFGWTGFITNFGLDGVIGEMQ